MSETRIHIIALADTMIRRKGFNAFTYADIATRMDVSNAALHYHFPAKADLGMAVIEAEMERLRGYRTQYQDRKDGHLQLQHLVETFYGNARNSSICLMGALTPEFATFDEPMKEVLQQLCVAIREWVADCLEDARAGGHLRFDGEAGDRAALVVSTLLASLLLARVEGLDLFRRMIDQMLRDLSADWKLGDNPVVSSGTDDLYSFT